MSARRVTNNSVSSLDEQNEVLQSILEKETGPKPSDKAKKPRRKKEKTQQGQKKKQKMADVPAALGVCLSEHGQELEEGQVWPTWSDAQAAVGAAHLGVLGNAVPGYPFGQVDVPNWQQGEDDDSHMEELDQVPRQAHNISDEEDSDVQLESEVEQEQVPVIPVPAIPEIKKKGQFAEILKENINHVKEADKLAKKLSPEVAFGVDKYIKDCLYTSDMEKLSKTHPRVANVESMKVPRLDVEVYQVIDQKVRNMDQSLQSIQKGIVGAISALSPLLELGYQRADTDQEFDDCASGLWESIQLMAFSLNTISARRRELIKPCLAPIYAQVLTKGHETSPDWLYGGNLMETTKKCEVAKKISEKILNKPQRQANKGQPQSRGAKQSSRGRGRGQLRGFNPHQGGRFPQHQQYQVPAYPNQGQGFPLEYPRYAMPRYQVPYGQQQQPNQYQGPNHLAFPKNKATYQK